VKELIMHKRWFILWVLATLCVPALANAHPGHGHTDPRSAAHYVVEPVHVMPVVVIAGALVLAALTLYLVWRARRSGRHDR
jgi:hypothetical protein